MDFFKRLLVFIFFALTIFSSNCSFAVQNDTLKAYNGVITAPKPVEQAYLNSKENEFNICATSNSENLSSLRRNEQNCSGSSDLAVFLTLNDFKKLNNFKNIDINLNSNSELALLFLLFELQPNAP